MDKFLSFAVVLFLSVPLCAQCGGGVGGGASGANCGGGGRGMYVPADSPPAEAGGPQEVTNLVAAPNGGGCSGGRGEGGACSAGRR